MSGLLRFETKIAKGEESEENSANLPIGTKHRLAMSYSHRYHLFYFVLKMHRSEPPLEIRAFIPALPAL